MNPINDVDADARSRQRYVRAGWGYAATISARAVSFLVAIVTIPLTLPYLGPERFGMWMTINSFATLLSFVNVGIGLSLMNSIARNEGRSEVAAQRASISSALALSALLALVLAVGTGIIWPFIPWPRILNVTSSIAVAEAGPSMAVFAATFLVTIPLGLVSTVWNGLQRSYVVGLFLALGSLLGIVGVAGSVGTHQGLPALVAAASVGPLIALTMSAALLLRKRPDLRPSGRLIGKGAVRALLGVGAGYFLLQVAIAVATSSDSLVLVQVIGPAAVTEYSVVARLFNVPLQLGVSVVVALWPGFSEARSRGDEDWVIVATRRVVLATIGITLPLVATLVFVGPEVTRVITKEGISPELGLYVAFAFATVAVVLASTASVFLISAGIVWPQVICWATMAVCNILLGIWLSGRVGTSGVVWATALTEGVLLIPLVLLGRRLLPKHRSSSLMEPG
jgi:Membrane protein involved in the export of O-antigen and teichoic acid